VCVSVPFWKGLTVNSCWSWGCVVLDFDGEGKKKVAISAWNSGLTTVKGIQDMLNNIERYTIVMLLFVLLDEIQKHYRIYTFFCYCLFLFSFLFLLVVYKQL
jgi:hypothetical protein